jgi:phosphatidylserine decarboxylase
MTRNAFPTNGAIPSEQKISVLEQAGGVSALLAIGSLAGIAGWLWRRRLGWLALAAANLSALAGVAWLFHNPPRQIPSDIGLVVAPCDGVVCRIARVQEPRFVKGPACQVTIQVRPGEVQVTRAPAGGVVRYRRYQPHGQAGQRDDTLWMGLRQPDGVKVLVQLTASPFWRAMPPFIGRRITALLDLEDTVDRGQVTGHLPLGGQVDVFVPATAQVTAEPGLRVRAGETVLAQL